MYSADKAESAIFIREVNPSEIGNVVEIHMSALPNDLLPSLGSKIVTRFYEYSLECQQREKIKLLGAFRKESLVGFCQLAFEPVSFISIIKIDTLLRLFFLAVTRPLVFTNGLIQFSHANYFFEQAAEIAFIAVAKNHQSNGIGSKLILAAMAECREQSRAWVITKTSNRKLINYYIKIFQAQKFKQFRAIGESYQVLKWSPSVKSLMGQGRFLG